MQSFQKIKRFLFVNESLRQTVAKNTFWLFVGEVGSRLLRMAIVIFAARLLGASGWGAFSYAITLSAFLTTFSDLGLSALLTREVSKMPHLRLQYLSTAFFIKLFLVAVGILFIIFVAPLFTKIEAAKPLLSIVALILAFDGLREFSFSLNRALEKMEWEAIVKVFTNFAIVVLGFALLILSPKPEMLALAYLVGSGLGFLFSLWTMRTYLTSIFSHFSRKLLSPIISTAWPFAITGVLGGIMIDTDTIMLSWFRTSAEVGFYAATQKPIQVFYIIPALIASALFPTFSRLAKEDNVKFRKVFEKSLSFVLMIALPLVFGGMILGKDLMLLLFGQEYLPAVGAFKILTLTLLIIFPSILTSNAIFAYNVQKYFIIFGALGAISNVIFNLLLIPTYGIYGAAMATVIAQLLANGVIWLKLKKINYFTVLPHLKNMLIATAIMTLIVFSLKQIGISFLVNVFLAALLYFGLLIFFKEPLLEEVRRINSKS